LELSILNVDKPALDRTEIEHRVVTIGNYRPYWLTRAATFAQKALLFPRATFLIGEDTLHRILDGRYYASERDRDIAHRTLVETECRLLLFGRLTSGKFQATDPSDLPRPLRAICDVVSEQEFRIDVSSTENRDQ
jgi:hypothetical protein